MNYTPPNTALFTRTLAMDNRHWQGYVFRLALMVVIIFILTSFGFQTLVSAQVTAAGRKFFQSLSNTNLFFISLFAVTLFSSAITEEKEIDSLNLLLMTGIGPFSMIISKSSSKMLVAIMLILAQFPFTLLAITMGGISLNQILSVYLTLICYTVLVANAALFFSVICSKSAQAATLTFIFLLLINFLAPLWQYTEFLCPFIRTNEILTTGFSGNPVDNPQIWGSLLVSLFFFGLSISLFNFFSRKNTGTSSIRFPGTTKKSRFRLFKISRVWREPIIWKEFNFCTGGLFAMTVLIILVLMIIGTVFFLGYYFDGRIPSRQDTGWWFIAMALILIFVEGVYISASLFSKEIWDKTHPILLLLPMSIKQIAYRKIAGGLIVILPNILLLAIGVICLGDKIYPKSTESFLFFAATCLYALAAVIFYYHLVTFFSLFVKYGSFAIAGLAFYLLQLVFSIPMMILPAMMGLFGFYGGWFGVVTLTLSVVIYLFATFFLHRFIGKKLIELAAN